MSPVVGRRCLKIRRCFILFSGLVTTTRSMYLTVPQYATYDIVDNLHDVKKYDRSSDFAKKGIHTMLTLSLNTCLSCK